VKKINIRSEKAVVLIKASRCARRPKFRCAN